MKKLLIIMVILILSLTLIGCGDSTPEGMVLVEAGTTSQDNGEITIEEDFYIGKYHVTQEEFESVMGFNPSEFSGGSDLPVESVTWYDTIKYSNLLSEADDLEKYYQISDIEYDGDNIISATVEENKEANGYRLATATEHEYAARGGKDGEATVYAGSDNLDEVGWYWRNSGDQYLESEWDYDELIENDSRTNPVGEKASNELGIYDMSGNVWDWTNTKDDSNRLVRGGGWFNDADSCEVALSESDEPSLVGSVLGFRIYKPKQGFQFLGFKL